MASINFNANDVDPSSPFEPLPNGTYRASIVESEIKPTKTGTGQYLQLVWQVMDGQYKGRKVWDRLNVSNKNEQAQEIAQRALSAICRAAGVMHLKDSQQLHDKPVLINVVVKQDKDYDPRNEIKKYSPVDGAAGVIAPGAPASAPAAAASAPSWAQARKAS